MKKAILSTALNRRTIIFGGTGMLLMAATQPIAISPKARRTEIVTLGTAGGPRPRPDRMQSANLLIVDGKLYLIDCGDGTLRQIVRAGENFDLIDNIFLTHNHSDHTLGLPVMIATFWEYQRRHPVTILGPRGTEAFVAGTMEALAVNAEIRSGEGFPQPLDSLVNVREIAVSQSEPVFRDARVFVRAVRNSHYRFPTGSLPYGRHESLSYRFDTADCSVVFTGDTGPSPKLLELTRGADTLVTEVSDPTEIVAYYRRNGLWQRKTPEEQAAWLKHQKEEHMTSAAVAELASAAGVRRVILTHFPPSGVVGDDFARRTAAVRAGFSGEVYAARDLDRF